MSATIHEKILAQLAAAGVRKKDLAAALGISPQTMTDVSKGRSAVTLKHLCGLIRFFRLRASYWLDDERDEPTPFDRLDAVPAETLRLLESMGLHDPARWQPTLRKLQAFVETHMDEFVAEQGPLTEDDRRLLGSARADAAELRTLPLNGARDTSAAQDAVGSSKS